MSVVCRAPPSTEAVGTRVRKNMSARSMSREFSDSEVHQRVRRKPCTALATYKPQWQEGMEVPRSLIACLSMLDLVSSEEESPGSRLCSSKHFKMTLWRRVVARYPLSARSSARWAYGAARW